MKGDRVNYRGDKSVAFNYQSQYAWATENYQAREHDKRNQPGMSMIDRETFNQWLLLDVRPNKLGRAREAPRHWYVWLERAYGKTEAKNYKILFHPFFKRWCLWERHQVQDRGSVWGLKYICCKASEADRDDLYWRVPRDYQDDPVLCALAQHIGEYREFTQDDFYELYGFERKHHTAKEVIEHSQATHVRKRAEAKANLREAIDSSNDYWFNAEMDLVNQEFGSGQRMRSYPTVEAHEPGTFRIEKEGYIVQAENDSLVGTVLQLQEEHGETPPETEIGTTNWASGRPKPATVGQSWLADYKERNKELFEPLPDLGDLSEPVEAETVIVEEREKVLVGSR